MKVKQRTSFAQLVGTTIKNYRLEQLVQQQSHMAIFLARCTNTEQIFQLRLFTLSAEIGTQERLILLGQVQQEVSRIAALQHRVIQPILEYGHEQGLTYLVTPFLSACYSLAEALSRQGPLDIIQTGTNLKLLASGLECAHKHAIIHGNLTASSVIVCPSAEGGKHILSSSSAILLTDTGIARLQTLLQYQGGGDSALHLSRTYGNAGLRRAEQSPGRPIESMTDIAALGALLYQMLTAHNVFADGLQEPGKQPQISPLNTWRADLPMQLDTVINTALARDPAAGYQSLNALVDAYYQAVAPGTIPASTHYPAQLSERQSVLEQEINSLRHETGAANAPILSQPFPRRRLAVALGATGAGIIVVGGVWLFLQTQNGAQVIQGSTPVAASGQQTAVPQATTPQQPTNTRTVIAHTADLPVNHASTFTIPNSTNPGVLIHLPDNRFVAFDTTCTHQGCPVSYSTKSKQLECPCHGAVFDPTRNAAVVGGPAPSPLASITIHVNADGTITV
jgi:Rieske Fe-S protein